MVLWSSPYFFFKKFTHSVYNEQMFYVVVCVVVAVVGAIRVTRV